jgi:phosphoribosyl 1,2-cyclic phosphodiesterase
MIDYGAAPSVDEIEITVFGPGFGEAIAVHLGAGNWILVDSCIDPHSKLPAAHTYLNAIGVNASQVKTIIASHWHDDHVRGISDLAGYYPEADFLISAALNNKEAATFLSAHNEAAGPGLSHGTNELYETPFFLSCRDRLLQNSKRTVEIFELLRCPPYLRHFPNHLPTLHNTSLTRTAAVQSIMRLN